MPTHQLLAFWLVTLLLVLVPGADWAFTVSVSARGASVLPAVAGLAAGYTLMTLAVAVGLGALVVGVPFALTALTLVGGAYLVGQGVLVLRRPPEPAAAVTTGDDAARLVARGIGVSGLNPKGLLMFLALLPQFADPRARVAVPVQLAVLGLVFVLTVSVFYVVLGSVAGAVVTGRPRVRLWLARASGVGMTVLGVALVAERVRGLVA